MEERKRPFLEKIEHIYEYYRYHILFTVLALILIGFYTYTVIEKRIERAEEAKLPPPAVTTMFFGNVPALLDEKMLEQYKLSLFPEWERAKVIVAYAPKNFKTDLDLAFVQRSIAILQVHYADLYVMDEEDFQIYTENELFMPLDDLEESLQAKISEDRLKYGKAERDQNDRLYGINIRGSEWFEGTQISSEADFFIGVRKDVQNKENALQLLDKIVETLN